MRLGFTLEASCFGLKAGLFGAGEAWANGLLSVAESDRLVVAALGIISAPEQEVSAEGVLDAYANAGLQALEHLRGDFAVAVWDGVSRVLHLLRDPMGGYPLFWTRHLGTFVVSTSLREVAAITGQRELDRTYVSALLCSSELTVGELETRRTCLNRIERVVPCFRISLTPAENRVDIARVWSWSDEIARVSATNWREAVEGYRDRLDTAIRRRMLGSIAAHLSGGMDSTSICALAARALHQRGAGERLHCLSLLFKDTPALAGETRAIERALDGIDAVPHRVRGEAFPPFGDLHRVPPHDEPAQASLWAAGETAMIEAATAAGCTSLLSGAGGDFALDAPPFHLADLLARVRLCKFIAGCSAWAQGQTTSFRTMAWVHGLQPLLLGLPGHPCREKVYRGPWAGYNGRDAPPWMRQPAAREAQAVLRNGVESSEPITSLGRRTRVALSLIREHRGDWTRWHLAAPRGVHLSHPFLDASTSAYALACVERMYPEPSRSKPLLADALSDFLPREIRMRRQKIDYNDHFFAGLIDNVGFLERLVRSPTLADLGVIEPNILLECLKQTALGIAPPGQASSRLYKALALALWLDRAKEPHDAGIAVRREVIRWHGENPPRNDPAITRGRSTSAD